MARAWGGLRGGGEAADGGVRSSTLDEGDRVSSHFMSASPSGQSMTRTQIDRQYMLVFAVCAVLTIAAALGGVFVGYSLRSTTSSVQTSLPPTHDSSDMNNQRAPGVDEFEEHVNWVSIIEVPPRHAEAYGACQVLLRDALHDRADELLTPDYLTYYPLPDDGSGKLRHGWRIRGLLGGDSIVAHIVHDVAGGLIREPAWRITYLKVRDRVVAGYDKPLPGVSTERLPF